MIFSPSLVSEGWNTHLWLYDIMCSTHCILLQWYGGCPTADTVWDGFVYTLVLRPLSGWGMTRVSKKAWIHHSCNLPWWTEFYHQWSLYALWNCPSVQIGWSQMCHLQTRGMWCCVESFYFKCLHINICYYRPYWWTHRSFFNCSCTCLEKMKWVFSRQNFNKQMMCLTDMDVLCWRSLSSSKCFWWSLWQVLWALM